MGSNPNFAIYLRFYLFETSRHLRPPCRVCRNSMQMEYRTVYAQCAHRRSSADQVVAPREVVIGTEVCSGVSLCRLARPCGRVWSPLKLRIQATSDFHVNLAHLRLLVRRISQQSRCQPDGQICSPSRCRCCVHPLQHEERLRRRSGRTSATESLALQDNMNTPTS